MWRLQAAPCDLDCHIKIAHMHSHEFLRNIRNVEMTGIENEAYRKNNLMTFFGEEILLEKLRAMDDYEFFVVRHPCEKLSITDARTQPEVMQPQTTAAAIALHLLLLIFSATVGGHLSNQMSGSQAELCHRTKLSDTIDIRKLDRNLERCVSDDAAKPFNLDM